MKRTPDPNHSLSSCHQPLCGTLERTKLVDRPGPHFPDPRLELAPTSPNPEQPGPGAQASSALLSPSPYSVLTWGGRLRGTHLPGVSRISKPAPPLGPDPPFSAAGSPATALPALRSGSELTRVTQEASEEASDCPNHSRCTKAGRSSARRNRIDTRAFPWRREGMGRKGEPEDVAPDWPERSGCSWAL